MYCTIVALQSFFITDIEKYLDSMRYVCRSVGTVLAIASQLERKKFVTGRWLTYHHLGLNNTVQQMYSI
jgi:hypothetical protein